MDIVIDFTPIFEFLSQPSYIIAWRMLVLFGWMPIAAVFIWAGGEFWLSHIRGQWGANIKYILLAIDIPRGNEQSPKAVENMFSYLGGAHASINFIDTWWDGKYQVSFSYEIVSIEGYTQFLIRTPAQFRDLVESSVYSQYPDAEITEVNDYTTGIPTTYPDNEYDIWGAEFIQAKNPVYPIKTYEEFEHKMGEPETHYKDPIGPLMDLCASLRKGEQLWYQIIVIPVSPNWGDTGDKEVAKIMGEKVESPKNLADKITDGFVAWLGDVSEFIYELWADIDDKKPEKEAAPLKMMDLKPHQKNKVEGIYKKIAKQGFEIKMRMVYVARKEVKNVPKVVNGFVGYMKQFMALDLNNIKPDMDVTATSTSYFFKEKRLNERKSKVIQNYIDRNDWAGRMPGKMNIEELATLWHFPVEAVVKAPFIQKAEGKKAKPPTSLPIGEEIVSTELSAPGFLDDADKKNNHNDMPRGGNNKEESGVPSNLPFV